jgi:CRP-like cAMP-binding protein
MHEEILDQFMSKSKLFHLLDEAGRHILASKAIPEQFAAGQEILKEGESGDSFYVLTSGTVRIFAEGFDQNHHLAHLGPGAVFGEIAALHHEPRTATVVTESPATAVRFEREDIMELLGRYPKMLEALNRIGVMRSEDALQKMLLA